jgi:hypothetical protein
MIDTAAGLSPTCVVLPAESVRLGLAFSLKVSCTQNLRFWECAVRDRRSRGAGLDGLYDGGHGADQLPESLDWLGFAGDVDAGV